MSAATRRVEANFIGGVLSICAAKLLAASRKVLSHKPADSILAAGVSMRRADRLFQIIQILRRSSRPTTAAALAEELEVSKRTVYRDVADLIGQRVPIVGVKPALTEPKESVDPSRLRSAIRNGRKLRLRYRSEAGEE